MHLLNATEQRFNAARGNIQFLIGARGRVLHNVKHRGDGVFQRRQIVTAFE
jgi:hypothetical protein